MRRSFPFLILTILVAAAVGLVGKGFGGKPVQILNLPNAAYQGYTQFKSVVHQHTGSDHPFKYSGTNGFTSTMDVGSGNGR